MASKTRLLASFLCGICFTLFSICTYAADYTYKDLSGNFLPSAASVCSNAFESQKPIGATGINSVRVLPDGAIGCILKYWDGSTQDVLGGYRFGDGCPAGTVVNSSGDCEKPEDPNKCEETLGTTTISLAPSVSLVGGVQPTNKAMCDGSCKFIYTGGNSVSCGSLKDNPTGPKYCIFTYTGNGVACDGSEEPANSGAPSPSPTPPKDPNDPTDPANNCKAVGYVWSGTSCVKYWEEDPKDENPTDPSPNPGTGGGGTGGGSGGGGTGGTGGGTGTGNGDSPAPGTGSGEVGGGSGEGTDETGNEASHSQDCKRPPACEGDVFSCAILNQNYYNACTLIALPTTAEKKGRDQELKIQADIMTENQEVLDNQVTGFIAKFMAAGNTGTGGGKCYPDKQVSIGGQTLQLPFSQVCDPLIILRYGLLAAAYLAAARILSREAL